MSKRSKEVDVYSAEFDLGFSKGFNLGQDKGYEEGRQDFAEEVDEFFESAERNGIIREGEFESIIDEMSAIFHIYFPK